MTRIAQEPDEGRWYLPPRDEDIDERFREAFVATKMAEILTELATDGHLLSLPVHDRTWLREQCESLVQDAVARLTPPRLESIGETVDQQSRREIGIGVRR